MSYANPAKLWVAALLADVGSSATVWSTASINYPNAVEIVVPFRASMAATVSLNPEIRVFRSTDGGATFETFENPFLVKAVDRKTSSSGRTTFTVPGGYWVFAACPGTPVTATVAIDTAEVTSAWAGA